MLRLIPPAVHRQALRVANRARIRLFRVFRPHLRSVSVIGLSPGERMLFIRLSYGSQGWTFPGGGIRRGEAPDAAARRELREETGCGIADLECVSVFDDRVIGTTSTHYLYTGTLLDMPEPDGREVVEARLFPLHSPPEPLDAKTARLLAIWRTGHGTHAAPPRV